MTNSSAVAQPIVAAYFPEWGIYGRNFQIADVPVNQLTHLIYAFARIDSNGQVSLFDSYAATDKRFTNPADAVAGKADSYYYPAGDSRATQTVFGNFNQITELKALNPKLRTSIAIGGWTLSGNFSTTLDTATEKEVFTNSVISFLKTYNMFDGVDFDWEYPGGGGLDGNSASSQDGVNYAETLKLLRAKLNGLGAESGRYYEISVASPAGVEKIPGMNLTELAKYVDFFNLMSYDFHGTWENSTGHQSALTGDPIGYDISTAVNAYLANEVPAGKIVLGNPLYTRAWTGVQASADDYGVADFGYKDASGGAAPGSFEKGVYDYKDLLNQYRAGGWQLIWDDNAQAAYLWNPAQKIYSSFETPGTIALKSAWAREKGLGGVMFWDLSNDATGDKNSLVKAASDYWLNGKSFADISAASGLTFDYVVGGNSAFDLAQILNDPNFGQGTGSPTIVTPTPVAPTPVVPTPVTPITVLPVPVVPTPSAPTPSRAATAELTAKLTLSGQWNGTFEGQIVISNTGNSAVSQWSATINSRYQLKNISDFSVTQTQLIDGTWQVNLKPPSWGLTLNAGASSSSYVQGTIPLGKTVQASDLLITGSTPNPIPLAASTTPQDPLINSGLSNSQIDIPKSPINDPITNSVGLRSINVAAADTLLTASNSFAETYKLSYAWGRNLTINGFNPSQDILDLRGFWGEAKASHGVAVAGGTNIDLAFNAPRVYLPGVEAHQLTNTNLLI
jgi:GH18 family chitinase